MVADTDNSGQKDDEYLPEVTGEERIVGEEVYSPEGETPLQGMEPESHEMAPQGTSLARKILTAIGLIIVAIAVSMYLTHKQKLKEAAQTGAPAAAKLAPMVTTEPTPITVTTPTPMKEQALKVVSTPAPVPESQKMVSPSAETIAKSVSAPPALAPKLPSAVAESAPKPMSVVAEPASKPVSAVAESAPKPMTAVAEPAPKPVTAVAESTSKPVSALAEPASNPVSVSAVPPTESPKIMGRLEELTAKTQTNQTQISDLSSRLDSINKAIITLNKSVETMEKKLSAPVLVAQPPRNQMATAMPGERTHRGHHRWGHHGRTVNVQPQQMMPMPMMGNVSSASYVIRAILPGRAWIEGAGGGAFSVMEGDRVPGFGTVSKIDPENGEVTMDTGDVIKYGSDDH